MRAVILTEEGVVELNWMWLPTWAGMDGVLKSQLEKEVRQELLGKEASKAVLDEVNERIIEKLARRVPHLKGVEDYLDGLKFVHEGE